MSKRKQSSADDSDDSSSDVSLIDVDFDFFDPNPSVDYQALKRLLSQLLGKDAEAYGLDLHGLTELVLGQPTVGTTIKTDGIAGDPYAILTVLNMHVHHVRPAVRAAPRSALTRPQAHPAMKALAHYVLEKAAADPAFHGALQALFSQSQTHVGLVLSERLINMPVQVVPPMYTMLANEMQFSHYLFVSRTYHLTPDEESLLLNSAHLKGPTSKKSKRAETAPPAPVPATAPDGVYPYHPEDEYIKLASTHAVDYRFKADSEPRDKEAFGLDTRGRIMLVPAERLARLIATLNEAYAPPA
ncbi:hypothetical protein C0993_008928 [Termitomyces sp. T159_Od127]|nr:hypothetical protein C0993_008928 [Termitomyces sp. T159_Od127]